MAEMETDNQFTAKYFGAEPKLDRRRHPALVQAGDYVRLRGVDGRFLGSFRRFPGFDVVKDIKDHIVVAAGDTDFIDTIFFFKYLTVQVAPEVDLETGDVTAGSVARALRGFVVAHDRVVRYIYRDPVTSVWASQNLLVERDTDPWFGDHDVAVISPGITQATQGVVTVSSGHNIHVDDTVTFSGVSGMTEINGLSGAAVLSVSTVTVTVNIDTSAFTAWTSGGTMAVEGRKNRAYWIDSSLGDPAVILADSEYDVASMGPFIYLVVNRATTTGTPDIQNDSDNNNRPTGSIPRDYYRLSIRVVAVGGTLEFHTSELGPLQDPLEFDDDPTERTSSGDLAADSYIRTGMRMFSDLKNVAGPLLFVKTVQSGGADRHFYRRRTGAANQYATDTLGFRGFIDLVEHQLDDDKMGPRLQVYRSIQSDWFESNNVDASALQGATMFREANHRVKDRDDTTILQPVSNFAADPLDTHVHASYGGTLDAVYSYYHVMFGYLGDVPTVLQDRLDPYRDDTAYFPRHVRLLQPYQGTLLRIGSLPRAALPNVTVDREEILSWGSLKRYAPEESRVLDATPLGTVNDERILSLVAAGDYAFAIGDTAVYRVLRDGQFLRITEVQTLTGGAGRYAAIGIGNSLYFVNPTGLFIVDGANEDFRLVSSLDRVIQEDWKDSLASVRLAYDNRMGAFMMLNDDLDEMILIWANTGLVTELTSVPFKFGTQGPDPEDATFARAFWINNKGVIFSANANRTTDVPLTMCGGAKNGMEGLDYIWNGTKPSVGGPKTMSVGTFDQLWWERFSPFCVGFYIHVLSGDDAGEKSIITSIQGSATTASGSQLFWADDLTRFEEGDRYAIAPIEFEVVGWPFQDPKVGPDLFTRKTVSAMSHSIILLGGETVLGDSEKQMQDRLNPNLFMEHHWYRRGDLTAPIAKFVAPMDEMPQKNFVNSEAHGPVIFPAWINRASNLDFEWLAGLVRGRILASEAEADPAET